MILKYASSALTTACMIGIAFIAHAEATQQIENVRNQEYVEQHHCLALNVYHEARSDSVLGQKAVGFVTLNRVHSSRYPDTICDVVYQAHLDSNGNPIRNKCQFSWWCDGKSDRPENQQAWVIAQQVADEVMQSYGVVEDFTEGATMYHASYVDPFWSDSYDRTVRIDTHIFYK